ncbi:EAL domain-containing protein [Acaryochloris sp. IP29b_bin.148]|uniref:bifunctional diguanylate cyclase/phosphodiesterase n=1 Tax=Acaryochloris sp. IP29b_bin.148 TaxID=2969218 RepID=UPI002636CE17|nr:EAL domain-containing protein [Acaryochloris sp. IP29b_bin.148]
MEQLKSWKKISFPLNRESPLRFILIVLFVLQLLVSVSLVGYLSLRNGEKAIEDLANQLMSEMGDRISERLSIYLLTPHHVNQLNEDALDMGQLKLNDLQSMEHHFWRQSQVFELISYIQFGNTQGEFVGLAVNDDGSLTYQVTESTGTLLTYSIDSHGNRKQHLKTAPNFDARHRPWYIVPQQADKPAWTEIYTWVSPPTLAITLGQPYYDAQGKFQGILATDLTLAQISDFLKGVRLNESGKTFILERSGNIVATSSDELPFVWHNNHPSRLMAIHSEDDIVQATAAYLAEKEGGLHKISARYQTRVSIKGQRYFLQVMPLQDQHGLNWLSVLVIPESSFMAQIDANTRTTVVLCLLAVVCATYLGICTASWIAKPILHLSQASQAISSGKFDQIFSVKGFREIGVLQRSFNRMTQKLQATFSDLEAANLALKNEIVERQRAEEQFKHLAFHDPLTGFPNRAFFMEQLERAVQQVQRHPDYLFAVLFIDLDRFKVVNDSLGHQVGDQLLAAIAHQLHCLVRATDIVARQGGDEFVILLEPIEDINDAMRVADRIIQELNSPFDLGNRQIFTSASIGIAFSSPDYTHGTDILRDADIAMYRAKSRGKACFEIFNERMHTQAMERLQLENDLRQALPLNQLQVFYQPIINIQTDKLVGFEALGRWLHPERGFISPLEFIPVAEETGLIVPLGEWILQTACQQMAAWLLRYPSTIPYTMSVNMSIKQLIDPNLLPKIDQALAQSGLQGHQLSIELTESILMENVIELNVILNHLKARGIQLCVDDFGTGYSSLSYLHLFPFNTIKIDQSFIARIGAQGGNQEIIETIIHLADLLEMDAISEGVESQQQLNYLVELSCQKAQGNYFSQPLCAKEAELFFYNNPQFLQVH